MPTRITTIGAALLVVVGLLGAGCSSGTTGTTATGEGPPCPVDPIDVVVSVDQWGGIVRQLAGRCAEVTTVISGAGVDPHEFEPAPADSAAIDGADLVVVNGLGYDEWAAKALETVSPRPPVVDAGQVLEAADGDNPHVWYDPTAVQRVADAVTAALVEQMPGAADVLQEQAAAWRQELVPMLEEISSLRAAVAGKGYAATEPVFDPMAAALGLVDRTPPGYRRAATNESEPAPADVDAFQSALRDGTVDVLVVNTQTEGALPARFRSVAEDAGVPVVEVSESIPAGDGSFVEWQLAQLRALKEALGA